MAPITLRTALVAGCTAFLVIVPGLPVYASAAPAVTSASSTLASPPAPVTHLVASLGVRGLQLRWTGSGTGTPVVRYLDGGTAPSSPTAGGGVTPTDRASAVDESSTNTSTRSYAVWAADVDGTTSDSAATIVVQPMTPSASKVTLVPAHTAISGGNSVTLNGRLARQSDNEPIPDATVDVLAKTVGTSTTTVVRRITSASDGTLGTSLKPAQSVQYQLHFAGDPGSATANSPAVVVRVVRNLVVGNSGDDVRLLEKYLTALHYDVGRADSRYDADLQHAVMAFQKVENLTVTGCWASPERTRAAHPRGIALRYRMGGRSVEVNVSRQVLVLAVNAKIVKIVDVSTGGEYKYTQDGKTYVAHTPRGRFHITRQINGYRTSRLGVLYKPSYFTGGYAIHGSPDVPSWPASHGCVRMTNSVTDRIYASLAVGTPVAVY